MDLSTASRINVADIVIINILSHQVFDTFLGPFGNKSLNCRLNIIPRNNTAVKLVDSRSKEISRKNF